MDMDINVCKIFLNFDRKNNRNNSFLLSVQVCFSHQNFVKRTFKKVQLCMIFIEDICTPKSQH